jgi:CHAD domain-containing protein
VAKARPIPDLSEDDPYGVAAAKIVAVRSRELADHASGVLDVSDIERVHDMRVATRRLRAALEVFEPCFPPKRFRAALREVKELADALGERRDRDVTIAALDEFAAAMGRADRAGISSLVERLRAEQAEANESLGPYVTEERMAALSERLSELVADAARDVGEDGARVPGATPATRQAANGVHDGGPTNGAGGSE